MTKIAALKGSVTPVEYYTQKLGIKTHKLQGWIPGGLCPFHEDRRPGSFFVNLTSGGFNCYSCGAKGGDILDFEQRESGRTLGQAISTISEQFGLEGTP